MDDKISVLPDEILVKILSYVPTKVAVSTSILSKRWEFLWMWLPKLDYTSSSSKLVLGEFINKNLTLHRAPVIESLRLDLIRRNPDIKPENVRQWVEIAVARHIREMEISYHSKNDESMFPSSLFTCNSLLTLKLRAVIITDVPSVGCLPSLKALQLDRVRFIDQDFLQDLLSICPVLEDLSVHCDKDANMKEFTIIVPSLQSLSLFIPNDLLFDWCEINTPSLKYFKLEDWNYFDHYILIRNMPKLREAYVDNKFFLMSVIESITSVKRLTICSEEDGYGDGFVFNQLEHLELCVCKENTLNLLCQMLKDSPNLRVLDISVVESHRFNDRDDMVCWNQPSSVPECLLSSLQIFNWSRYFGRPQDRDIAVYILKNACQLKTATILADTEAHDVPNLKMIKELTLSNRASSSCELVFVEG